MRREGRIHGYEFQRKTNERVKACNQPTNRSKFRSKYAEEKAGRPGCKALKKMKGQRNKAHGADLSSNHKMHDWVLKTGSDGGGYSKAVKVLADSISESAGADLIEQGEEDAHVTEALRHVLLGEAFQIHEMQNSIAMEMPQRQRQQQEQHEQNDEEASHYSSDHVYDSDWSDLASTKGYEDDDWYLC